MAIEESILKSTKKTLGLADSLVVFDQDVLMHINAILTVLNNYGIGPTDGLYVDDEGVEWSDLGESQKLTNLIKSWLLLRVRMLFDPPTTSFHITAIQEQIAEFEFRLFVDRDNRVEQVYPEPEEVEV